MQNTPLIVANMILAAMASGVNVWAAVTDRPGPWTPFRWLRGSLGLLYAALYAVQVAGWLGTGTGTTVARSVNLVTWVVVWMLPALVRADRLDPDEVAREVLRRWREEINSPGQEV